MTEEHAVQTILTWALVCLTSVVLYMGLFVQLQHSTQAAGRAYTMAVCSQMATGSDYKRVKACGDAQDQYKLEYLCNGDTVDSGCWVEEK